VFNIIYHKLINFKIDKHWLTLNKYNMYLYDNNVNYRKSPVTYYHLTYCTTSTDACNFKLQILNFILIRHIKT